MNHWRCTCYALRDACRRRSTVILFRTRQRVDMDASLAAAFIRAVRTGSIRVLSAVILAKLQVSMKASSLLCARASGPVHFVLQRGLGAPCNWLDQQFQLCAIELCHFHFCTARHFRIGTCMSGGSCVWIPTQKDKIWGSNSVAHILQDLWRKLRHPRENRFTTIVIPHRAPQCSLHLKLAPPSTSLTV